MPPQLLINADDFGLTQGVNRAIGELHAAGALTSATLMASGPAFDHAVEIARKHPGLDVGCHVVLVDGLAVAPAETIPSLLTSAGTLRTSLSRFIYDLQVARSISEQEIQAEATAQIQRLQQAGLRVSHIDTHKHTHLLPRVAAPILRAAAACGVPAIRNPFEPAWSARLTRGPLLRKLEVKLLRGYLQSFHRLREVSGIATTDGCIGVSATGNLDGANLRTLLSSLPAGRFELVCHPGYNDAALRAVATRLQQTRDIERAALTDQIPAAHGAGRLELLTFADL